MRFLKAFEVHESMKNQYNSLKATIKNKQKSKKKLVIKTHKGGGWGGEIDFQNILDSFSE